MPFESGSLSFSLFRVSALPRDVTQRFARVSLPPLKALGADEIQGWVGYRHLLDTPVSEENAYFGGYLFLSLVRAERRVPPALLRIYCRMEEIAQARAEGVGWLSARRRAEIRRAQQERLRSEMPPHIRAISFVHLPARELLLVQASAPAQADLFAVEFMKATGEKPEWVDSVSLARWRRRVNPEDWPHASFSPRRSDVAVLAPPGSQFLTWLWFYTETRGGCVRTEREGEFACALDGPLVFHAEGDGAHEIRVQRGAPLLSAEAKTCLLVGKTLRSARLMIAQHESEWRATVTSDPLVIRGLRLPEDRGPDRARDPITRFQERMMATDRFLECLLTLFDLFIEERSDPRRWQRTLGEIREWVASRSPRD